MAKTWEIQWVKDWIGMGQGSAPGKILCNKYTCVQHKFQLVAMSLSFNHKREVVNAQGVEQFVVQRHHGGNRTLSSGVGRGWHCSKQGKIQRSDHVLALS
jgi:hypothetical protein